MTNKKVLITGVAGLLGSRLADWIIENQPDYQVIGIDDLSGGYKENEFEEYHYKVLAVGESLAEASKKSKSTAFYKHCGFKGATSHIDDKFGIDVDDIFNVKDILSSTFKDNFEIQIAQQTDPLPEDVLHIGYLKIDKIQ